MSEFTSERIEKGFEQLRQMLVGNRAEEVRKQWHQISPDFESLVLGVLAGEVWTRPGLDFRRLAKDVDPLVALKRELPYHIVAELSTESLNLHLEAGFCQPIGEVLPPVIPDMVVLPELLVARFHPSQRSILAGAVIGAGEKPLENRRGVLPCEAVGAAERACDDRHEERGSCSRRLRILVQGRVDASCRG